MEAKTQCSTGPRTCEEMADIAIRHAEQFGHPIDVLAPPVAQAVEAIIADLTDRRGLRHEWEQIDSDVQDEIRYVWGIIIEKALDTAPEKEQE